MLAHSPHNMSNNGSFSNERGSNFDGEYTADAVSGGFFHTDFKKHEDLKMMLDSNKDSLKLEAMKRIIGMVAKGRDASMLFPSVVKNVVSKNIEIKKLVYVYLERYAEEQQDLALLSISTFQRALKEPNPLIRAGALRVLSSIRVKMISPIVMIAIKDASSDMSSYVRKTAAHAIPKLYSLDPELKQELITIIQKLLADKTVLVIGSAVMAFTQVCPERIDLIHAVYRKLCALIIDVDEWGQVTIVNMLTRYARMQFADPNKEIQVSSHSDDDSSSEASAKPIPTIDPDHRLLLRSTKPLLQSRNAAVVMAVAQLYHHTAPRAESIYTAKALVRLLRSHIEVQIVVLNTIASISAQNKSMFDPFLKSFFVRTSDPTNIKLLKLEILTNLASDTNVMIVLRELQTYINHTDKQFVSATIQAIGRCACTISDVTDICLNGLVILLSNKDEAVVAESVVVIKRLLQTQAADPQEIVTHMAKLLDSITVPQARAAILWLLGEHSEKISRIAPDVLRKAAKSFADEEDIVKMQIMNLAAKLFINNPVQCTKLCQYVFNLARYDQNYDIRDKARFLKFCVLDEESMFASYVDLIFLSEKPAPIPQSQFKDYEGLQLGSLSHYIKQRAHGYEPLPDFPEVPPSGEPRNVEPLPNTSQDKSTAKEKKNKMLFSWEMASSIRLTSSSSEESSSSESESEDGSGESEESSSEEKKEKTSSELSDSSESRSISEVSTSEDSKADTRKGHLGLKTSLSSKLFEDVDVDLLLDVNDDPPTSKRGFTLHDLLSLSKSSEPVSESRSRPPKSDPNLSDIKASILLSLPTLIGSLPESSSNSEDSTPPEERDVDVNLEDQSPRLPPSRADSGRCLVPEPMSFPDVSARPTEHDIFLRSENVTLDSDPCLVPKSVSYPDLALKLTSSTAQNLHYTNDKRRASKKKAVVNPLTDSGPRSLPKPRSSPDLEFAISDLILTSSKMSSEYLMKDSGPRPVPKPTSPSDVEPKFIGSAVNIAGGKIPSRSSRKSVKASERESKVVSSSGKSASRKKTFESLQKSATQGESKGRKESLKLSEVDKISSSEGVHKSKVSNLDLLLELDDDIGEVPTLFTKYGLGNVSGSVCQEDVIKEIQPGPGDTIKFELLNRITGRGLQIEYIYTRLQNIFKPQMVNFNLSISNLNKEVITNIRMEKKQSQIPVQEFPPVSSLNPHCSTNVALNVDFGDSTNPFNFEVVCSLGSFPVCIKPCIGELVKPITMSQKLFIKNQMRLQGMSEHKKSIPLCSLDIPEKMNSAANLGLCPSDDPNCLRFAGKTMSSSNLVLVTVDRTNMTVTVNCENPVFGQVLLNQLTNFTF